MGMRIPHSIPVYDLLANEIKVLFLTLTVELNLNLNDTKIMDQNGTRNTRFP